MTLTIFTPTYNRDRLLPKLYESLTNQTSKEFIWLIVDDGSTDGTSELVSKWQAERIIQIQYIRQDNGGKHVAHNTAVSACKTDWFVCVDSDDFLAHNHVVELIVEYINTVQHTPLAGIVIPKTIVNRVNETIPVKEDFNITLRGLYLTGFKGETTLIYRTSILKKFPFPRFKGEKFVTEVVVYDQIDDHYQMLFKRNPIVVCEYQEDGYSNNFKRLFLQNPKGWAFRFNQQAKYAQTTKQRLFSCAQYVCFRLIAKQYGWMHEANYPLLSFLSLPLAIYYKRTRYSL